MSFTGPGKREFELREALEGGLGELIVESVAEAVMADRIAGSIGIVQDIMIRISPDHVPKGFGDQMAGRPSAFGIEGLVGNGWEWTSTTFQPFPGFKPFDFYPGYSANFFDDQHYVLKGASPQTDSRFLRRSFRNWFQPNYPYVYATFRCVDN